MNPSPALQRVAVIATLALTAATPWLGCNADDGWVVRHEETVDNAPRLCRYPLGMLADERARLVEAAGTLEPGADARPRPGEPKSTTPDEASSPAPPPAAEPNARARPEAPETTRPEKRKRRRKKRKEPATAEPATAGSCIDLATASAGELERLPGVGPSLARRIVEARARRPFASASQLDRVKGIGASRARKIAPLLCPL